MSALHVGLFLFGPDTAFQEISIVLRVEAHLGLACFEYNEERQIPR